MGASRAELQVSFSWPHRVPDRHYHRGTLEASQSNFHLACGDRRAAASSRTSAAILREISPQESISARHKTTKRGRHGSPHAWAATKVPSCGPDPAIAARAANLRAVPPQKVGPVTVRGENPSYISESYKSYRVLVYFTSTQDNLKGFARSRNPSDGPGVCVLKPANIMMRETKYISPPRQRN